jgi:hypothetical protein
MIVVIIFPFWFPPMVGLQLRSIILVVVIISSKLQSIMICQDVMGTHEKSSGLMHVPPSHANDHVHDFLDFVGGYILHGWILLPSGIHIYHFVAFIVLPSLFDNKTFDKHSLFFIFFHLVHGVASISMSPMCTLRYCHLCLLLIMLMESYKICH